MTVMPISDINTIATKSSNQFFESKFKDPIAYIDASDSYDYGLKIGQQFRLQYKILDALSGSTNNKDFNGKNIKDQITFLEQDCPYFLEELKGLSDSVNIKLGRLLFLQNSLHSLIGGECTATLATGKATKNNETFLTFNVDTSLGIGKTFMTILHRLFTFKCWIVRINTLNYRYAFWGIPIIFEYPFLNEKGLGWGSTGTGLTINESRYIDEGPGIPTMLLEKLAMMTCKNVSEVTKLYKNMERSSEKDKDWFHQYDVSSSCFCDKEGGILIIEQTHNHIITVFGNSTDVTGSKEGILWHANHHQWLDPDLTGSMYPSEYPSSALRAERAYELLNNSYGNITLDVCKKITRDHGGGFDPNGRDPGDICRHPYKDNPRVTAFAFIIQPKEMTVYWTHRSPCKSLFWKHDFSRIFS